MPLVGALPLPHGDGVVRAVVHGRQQRAAVGARERHARHRALHVAGAQHGQRGQGHGVPHAHVRLESWTLLTLMHRPWTLQGPVDG